MVGRPSKAQLAGGLALVAVGIAVALLAVGAVLTRIDHANANARAARAEAKHLREELHNARVELRAAITLIDPREREQNDRLADLEAAQENVCMTMQIMINETNWPSPARVRLPSVPGCPDFKIPEEE